MIRREIYDERRKQCISAMMGLVVGDALGVPVEFMSREELDEKPVKEMTGYGTYCQPAGTWSDDSSMAIATMEWLGEIKELPPDYKSLMDKFSCWLLYGDYTPYGRTFDCGVATHNAIMNYGRGMEPVQCGGKSEYDNGNGSLMRILPAALWYSDYLALKELDHVRFIYDLSSLTHGHIRSKLGCLIYSKIIADMMHMPGEDKFAVVEKSLSCCREYLESETDKDVADEKDKYSRLWNLGKFKALPRDDIRSSGYVVDTLEAAVWCFLNTDNYKECVLKAVNLGNDTDTIAAVSGGLAGLYYGIEKIPKEWIDIIPKKAWIIELAEKMVQGTAQEGKNHMSHSKQEEEAGEIIIFPDFQKLKDEVEKLRIELSMLLLERDELRFVICKNIEAEYMLKLGSLEYKAYEAQCAAMRLKRKIELIQAKKNCQEKINLPKIEETLDMELREYQQKLNEQIEKMNDAIKRGKAEFLSEEENKEIKQLYRKIVKVLHPDINPEVTEAQIKLLDNAVAAYKNGDIATLRIIDEMVGEHQLPEKHQDALSQLKKEKERLEGMLKNVKDSIDRIKSEYPYSVKEILQDEAKVEQKKAELEKVLAQYKELIEIYNAKIKEMLR